jgi:hypothetical protein
MYNRELLISLLTQHDIKEEKRAMNGKYLHNIYALAHYFKAVQDMDELIKEGKTPSVAYSSVFCPSSWTHSIAKKLGFNLDVIYGNWVIR